MLKLFDNCVKLMFMFDKVCVVGIMFVEGELFKFKLFVKI